MNTKIVTLVVAVLAVAAGLSGFALNRLHSGTQLTVVVPNAIGIVTGTPVQLNGFDVGEVTAVRAQGDRAVLSLGLEHLQDPLHAGTTVTVEWRSLLGERYLHLLPGRAGNPPLPDRAMIEAGSSQVVVEDLLEALDPATRVHLASTIEQLNAALQGSQPNLNQTLQTAGPTVQALGAVLNAIGTDGGAIKTVLANLRQVTQVLAARRAGLSSTVQDLNRASSAVAEHEQQLSDGLAQLPGTLQSTKRALDKVPAAAESTIPLLNDLRPATDRLPHLAGNLSPVMHDLRPILGELRPTLGAADRLLGKTPDFLDDTRDVLPQLRTTMQRAQAPVAFLRPYTPEIMGFLSNWGSTWSSYDSQGGAVRPIAVQGSTSVNDSPNVRTPGEQVKPPLVPGAIVNQPWTDANGSAPR